MKFHGLSKALTLSTILKKEWSFVYPSPRMRNKELQHDFYKLAEIFNSCVPYRLANAYTICLS